MSDAICDLDVRSIRDAIATGKLSCVEVTEAHLRRIERHDAVLRSYITVTADQALARAQAADAERQRGKAVGALHGIPLGIKDLVAVAGVRMTAGSPSLADHVSAGDATVTERLRAAGAVILGKLAMHEFAFGRPAAGGPFPTGRNPWDIRRAPGGSSSGSAVAVSAGLAAAALGSDTGGSIRAPASMCGIVGLKPTYGLVSRHGVLPLSWSLDHVGPMTRTVGDAAIVLQAIAGPDPRDPSTHHARAADYTAALESGVRGMRLGLPRRAYMDWPGLSGEVRGAALLAFAELERQGATVEDVDVPTVDLAPAIWAVFTAEMYDLHAETLRDRPHCYGELTKPRLRMGAFFTARDLVRAQRLRARLGSEVAAVLETVDALVLPGQATPAVPFEESPTAGLMPVASRYASPWNLIGLPAIVVPCGFSQDGLPVSIQIVGRPFDDATVLRIARAYERATDWHRRRPDPAGWRLS